MKKYCLVSDDSGHDYVIPVEHRSAWYDFDFSDYDFDLPDWAIQVEGGLEFENPTEDGKPLFGAPTNENNSVTYSYELESDPNNSEIKDLNAFNAYLLYAAQSKVGFRFKVKELKRYINAITNY